MGWYYNTAKPGDEETCITNVHVVLSYLHTSKHNLHFIKQTKNIRFTFSPSLTGLYDHLFEFNFVKNFYICMVIGRNDWWETHNVWIKSNLTWWTWWKLWLILRSLLSYNFLFLTHDYLRFRIFTCDCCLRNH